MKQTAVFLAKTILFFCALTNAKPSFSQQKQGESKLEPSAFSISLGYGTHAFTSRIDLNLSNIIDGLSMKNGNTRIYVDLGIAGKSFTNPNFSFRNTNYSSNVLLMDIGAGLSEEFLFSGNHVALAPFIGIRYEKARFTDKTLVDAIGTSGLIRTYAGNQVGPEIKNGYGDATTIDLGFRLGYKFARTFELFANLGYSPIKYSTSGTLFGQYWGQASINNDYYINRPNIRAEGGLRINF